jgi:hypothetical protein
VSALVARLCAQLRAALVNLDLAVLDGDACAGLVAELAVTEKACAAARVIAARRAADCDAHRGLGFRDEVEWLARAGGTSRGEARRGLEVAAGLDACRATRALLAAGGLSLGEAHEIVTAEAACPGVEAGLLDVARDHPLHTLRDAARKHRVGAVPADELHQHQRSVRRFKHWRDDLGMVCLGGALSPDVGVALINRLDAETDRLRRAAKAAGGPVEAREAYAADALINLTNGDARPRARGTDLVLVCDLRAWRRGHTHQGEPCHIIGGGPLPVDIVKSLATDAFVKVVFHNGVDIHTVTHIGRYMKVELRTALELGAPPDFDGVTCVEPGCGRRYNLEWDHIDPVANRGPTSYANLEPRCWPDHQDKTERDRAAGLLDGKAGVAPHDRAPP